VLFELGFKAGKEAEGIGCRAGKACENLAVIEAAELAGAAFEYFRALRHLAVASHDDLAFAAHAQDCGRSYPLFHSKLQCKINGISMIELKVNGQARKFDGDGDMPLLWYLREELSLTGSKFGCGMGLCGACTVHRNGEAIRSCVTPVKDVAGKDITTIEGLSPNGTHPCQVAWEKHGVAQCGYCQAGQIMQAASLLKKTPKPTDDQIDAAMNGNICRCGTYTRIRAAVKSAAGVKA